MHEQRKLFILVFLWTCLCLVILKSSLLASSKQQQQQGEARAEKLFARSAAAASSSLEDPLYLSDPFRDSPPTDEKSFNRHEGKSEEEPPSSRETEEKEDDDADADETKRQERRQSEKKPASDTTQNKHNIQQQQVSSNSNKQQHEECLYNYPNLFDIQFNNIYWQKFSNSFNSSSSSASSKKTDKPALYYLYNAYYDDRWRAGLPSVRVLAMIDRIQPPPSNCLLWSEKLREEPAQGEQPGKLIPVITRAQFVYAWYPKWGNYKDGLLQPWIVTCPVPKAHLSLVPDSVSLVQVPELSLELEQLKREPRSIRAERASAAADSSSIPMPASFSSSLPSVQQQQQQQLQVVSSTKIATNQQQQQQQHNPGRLNCDKTLPITNNLPVFNRRPKKKEKFAVCVKGLDFPHEDVSVRLVEWIELLNLLGASKIFLYNLDVHENVTRVLDYYEKRGLVELTQLTLPGDQPNLPEYQHLYLKSKLTTKRQNELIPYNDCLYRNLNSYQYLALLDIDEIIMPLKHRTWFELMNEVESISLREQNYSRASYNVRNVYFFDDLVGPLGTTSSSDSSSSSSSSSQENSLSDSSSSDDFSSSSLAHADQDRSSAAIGEHGIPHYLHMMQHVYRSKNYTKPGQYVKCFHNTERVVSLHNHFPMNCFGQCTTFSVPLIFAHLQHYRKDCVGPLKQSCKNDFRVFTKRDTTIWKYKQQMIKRTTRVLHHLKLIDGSPT